MVPYCANKNAACIPTKVTSKEVNMETLKRVFSEGFLLNGVYTSLTATAADALICESKLDIKAATTAATRNAKIASELATREATTVNTPFALPFGNKSVITPGVIFSIALANQPEFETATVPIGKKTNTFIIVALLAWITDRDAKNLIITAWFINANPTEPTTPSCQKIPTKLKSGGELKSANGNLFVADKLLQKKSNPPK